MVGILGSTQQIQEGLGSVLQSRYMCVCVCVCVRVG